ncbi:MAG TPA: hypothetical protein VE967_05975 [Gemmatimonadaceae bacterium]|nr:hypothetical protein [Gemmatimonadaceae bacterium]
MRRSFVTAVFVLPLVFPSAPGLRTSVVMRDGPAPGQLALVVRIESTDLSLGSYQGTLKFTPGSLAIVSASAPAGEGTRMVNAADTTKGIVHFAGFTVSGYSRVDVLTLVVRATRAPAAANIVASVDVAGDVNGKPVPHERITPARGITTDSTRR